jgi:hypothetical protein
LGNRYAEKVSNALDITEHVIIPETKHPIAIGGEPRIAPLVVAAIGMLATIDLDDELQFVGENVSEVCSDRDLAPEFRVLELSRAQ